MKNRLWKNRFPRCRNATAALIGVLLILASPQLFAADITWTGDTDTDFNTGGNWAGGKHTIHELKANSMP